MLKKILISLLCVCILLPMLLSCNQSLPPENETPEIESPNESSSNVGINSSRPPYDNPTDVFSDYYSIVNIYGTIIKNLIIDDHFNEDCFDEIYTIYEGRLKSETEREWLMKLTVAAWELFHVSYEVGKPNYVNACGYAVKDLNGDGIDELLLMNYDYTVVALFSSVNGRPSLLETFSNSYTCRIDSDGLIYISCSETADKNSISTYRIADGGTGLDLLFKFGRDEHEWKDSADGLSQELVEYFFKYDGGESIPIAKEEYEALNEQHTRHFDGMSASDSNKAFSELEYKPVFDPPYSFGNYEEILASLKKITSLYNTYKLEPDSKGAFDWYFDLSTERKREFYDQLNDLVITWYPPSLGASTPAKNAFAYGIKDLDGNGIEELILIEGDRLQAFAVLTKKNGRIVFDNSFSFEYTYGNKYHRLSFWMNTVGLDLKPLFPESSYFDTDAYRREMMVTFDKLLSGYPYHSLWLTDEEAIVELDDYLATLPYAPYGYAFVDMDNDTVDELVIKFIDRYVIIGSRLYTYTLYCDKIFTDGSFGWRSQDSNLTYGESRFNSTISLSDTKELWKVVNDGEPNAEYYIGSKQVSKEELSKYCEGLSQKSQVMFTSIDSLWGGKLSPLDALEIAEEYWKESLAELNGNYKDKYPWNENDGYQCEFCYHSSFYQNSLPKVPENVYMFRIHRTSGAWNAISEIWIDAVTGEIYRPYCVR